MSIRTRSLVLKVTDVPQILDLYNSSMSSKYKIVLPGVLMAVLHREEDECCTRCDRTGKVLQKISPLEQQTFYNKCKNIESSSCMKSIMMKFYYL